VRLERSSNGGGRRHQTDLANPLRTEGSFRLVLLDQDDLDLGHVPGSEHSELAELEGGRHAVRARQLLGERVAQAHVYGPLDLPLAQGGVDRPADVVSGDDSLHPSFAVEDADLSCESVGRMGLDPIGVLTGRGGVVDEDFAFVDVADEILEAPAVGQVGRQPPGRLLHCQPAEKGGTGAGRLPAIQLEGGVDPGMEDRGGEASDFGGDLHEHRQQPLSHLGVAVVERNAAVVFHHQSSPAPFLGAVADAAVLDAAADAHGPTGLAGFEIVILDLQQALLESDGLLQHLAGSRGVSHLQSVAPPHLPAIQAYLGGQQIEGPLDGEMGLVGAETSHGTTGRVVGHHGTSYERDMGHPVGPTGVSGGALEDLGADRSVGAGVANHLRLDGRQPALGIAAHRIAHGDGMTLGVESDRLLPVERDLDWASGHLGQQGGLGLNRHVLLAAEGTAVGHQLDLQSLLVDTQDGGYLAPVIEDSLSLGVELQAAAG